MTREEREAAATRRYQTAAHGMQSATAMQITVLGENGAGADPKHLRTGINVAMSDLGAIANLLIEKGVFTSTEYLEAIATQMEREHLNRSAETREKCGLPESVKFS